jgi:hypothetical protein
MVCDDDCLAPNIIGEPPYYWDGALSIMIEAGWKVVGHPSRLSFYDKATYKKIGGVKGSGRGHVAGAFSGFSVETWKIKGGVPSNDKLFGFGPFCNRFPEEVGYYVEHQFLVTDIDRIGHPWSLRDRDYYDWYAYMRPNKAQKIERKYDGY